MSQKSLTRVNKENKSLIMLLQATKIICVGHNNVTIPTLNDYTKKNEHKKRSQE